MSLFTDLTDQLEKAARNGQKAHIAPEVVRALIESDAYPILQENRRRELAELWQGDRPLLQKCSSAPTISNTEKNETTGTSAGTIPQFVHDAASELALEAAREARRQKPR